MQNITYDNRFIKLGLAFYTAGRDVCWIKSWNKNCYLIVQVIKMLVIVVVVFAVCWLPFQTYQVGAMLFPPINQ